MRCCSAARFLAQSQDHVVRRGQGPGRDQREDAAAQGHAAVQSVFAVQRGRDARGRGQDVVAVHVGRAESRCGSDAVTERPFMIAAVGLGEKKFFLKKNTVKAEKERKE